jgi:hypothetical protein
MNKVPLIAKLVLEVLSPPCFQNLCPLQGLIGFFKRRRLANPREMAPKPSPGHREGTFLTRPDQTAVNASDRHEILGGKARAADKRAIDIVDPHQFLGIAGLH